MVFRGIFTAAAEAGLRAQGIDPVVAPASDLVPALLRVSGYSVSGSGARLSATLTRLEQGLTGQLRHEGSKTPVTLFLKGENIQFQFSQMLDFDGWIVPAGLPEDRLARVMDFLNFATDTQRLADQAAYISYGPARASSAPLVGNHAELGIPMAPHMPTDPANAQNVFVTQYEFWADYRDDIDAKFQAWLAK